MENNEAEYADRQAGTLASIYVNTSLQGNRNNLPEVYVRLLIAVASEVVIRGWLNEGNVLVAGLLALFVCRADSWGQFTALGKAARSMVGGRCDPDTVRFTVGEAGGGAGARPS